MSMIMKHLLFVFAIYVCLALLIVSLGSIPYLKGVIKG